MAESAEARGYTLLNTNILFTFEEWEILVHIGRCRCGHHGIFHEGPEDSGACSLCNGPSPCEQFARGGAV